MHRSTRSLHKLKTRPPHNPHHRLLTNRLDKQRRREEKIISPQFPCDKIRIKDKNKQLTKIDKTHVKTKQTTHQSISHVLTLIKRACERMLSNCINQYLNSDY